jgi:hypothetical protein
LKPMFWCIYLRGIHDDGKYYCNKCAVKLFTSKKQAFDYDFVKNYIESFKGYKLISEVYINCDTPLKIQCSEGHIFYMDFYHFKNRKQRCSKCVGGVRLEGNFVYKEFINIGLNPLFNENDYQNAHQELSCVCTKHKEYGIQNITYDSIKQGVGCRICYYENSSYENYINSNSSIPTLSKYMRNEINIWQKDSMCNCGYLCVLTNKKFNDIHHLYGFNIILIEVLRDLKLNSHKYFIHYTLDELEIIKNKLIEYHYKYPLGVCLNKNLHKLFHKLYNNKNNTPEQFKEFVTRLRLDEFNDFLKENNLELNINYDIINNII